MTYRIDSPFQYFADLSGDALDAGKIYIGTAGLDAETNPITVYWDRAKTSPASQPIRTDQGIPVNGGSAANIFVDSSYSITVRDNNDVLVYSNTSVTDPAPLQDAEETSIDAITNMTATHTQGALEELQGDVDSFNGALGSTPPTISSGDALKYVRVNSGETALEFFNPAFVPIAAAFVDDGSSGSFNAALETGCTVTRNSTGLYTFTFSTARADTNYIICLSGQGQYDQILNYGTKLAASFVVSCYDSGSAALADAINFDVIVFEAPS